MPWKTYAKACPEKQIEALAKRFMEAESLDQLRQWARRNAKILVNRIMTSSSRTKTEHFFLRIRRSCSKEFPESLVWTMKKLFFRLPSFLFAACCLLDLQEASRTFGNRRTNLKKGRPAIARDHAIWTWRHLHDMGYKRNLHNLSFLLMDFQTLLCKYNDLLVENTPA